MSYSSKSEENLTPKQSWQRRAAAKNLEKTGFFQSAVAPSTSFDGEEVPREPLFSSKAHVPRDARRKEWKEKTAREAGVRPAFFLSEKKSALQSLSKKAKRWRKKEIVGKNGAVEGLMVVFLGIFFVVGAVGGASFSQASPRAQVRAFRPTDAAAKFDLAAATAASDGVFLGVGGAAGPDILFEETADPAMVLGTSFLSPQPPTTADSEESSEPRTVIVEYIVGPGETVSEIAQFFGVSTKTILWANNLSSRSIIKPGQTLLIPPVSGTLHTVKRGDTCSSIAARYKADEQKIIDFNNLNESCDLFVGEVLVVPGGIMPPSPPRRYAPTHVANTPRGFFVFPTTGRITQGVHPVNAIDIANRCGTPVVAAAGGTVIDIGLTRSASRYANRGYGNFVKILHENNIATLYAHLQSVFVRVGETVAQGDVIAAMGGRPWTPGSGRSTGCHLHFEVRGAGNPFAR